MKNITRALDFMYRADDDDEVQIRLFEDPDHKDGKVMHINIDVEEMKALRDFLNKRIEAIENK